MKAVSCARVWLFPKKCFLDTPEKNHFSPFCISMKMQIYLSLTGKPWNLKTNSASHHVFTLWGMQYESVRCMLSCIYHIYIPWNLNQGPSFVFSLWPNLLNTRSLSISPNSRLLFSNFLSLAGFVKSGIFPHLTLPHFSRSHLDLDYQWQITQLVNRRIQIIITSGKRSICEPS